MPAPPEALIPPQDPPRPDRGSTLRVHIRARERPVGGVAFMSRQPDAYRDEDGVFASRIADHVALAVADATQVAATDTTVLITGESGTGKQLIARYIHPGSKLKARSRTLWRKSLVGGWES